MTSSATLFGKSIVTVAGLEYTIWPVNAPATVRPTPNALPKFEFARSVIPSPNRSLRPLPSGYSAEAPTLNDCVRPEHCRKRDRDLRDPNAAGSHSTSTMIDSLLRGQEKNHGRVPRRSGRRIDFHTGFEVHLENADAIRHGGKDAEAKPVAVEVSSDARAKIVRHFIGAKVYFQERPTASAQRMGHPYFRK